MKKAETRALLEALVLSDRAEVPASLYPEGWLARAAELEAGKAAPLDWVAA